jgi:hypothetical protein
MPPSPTPKFIPKNKPNKPEAAESAMEQRIRLAEENAEAAQQSQRKFQQKYFDQKKITDEYQLAYAELKGRYDRETKTYQEEIERLKKGIERLNEQLNIQLKQATK